MFANVVLPIIGHLNLRCKVDTNVITSILNFIQIHLEFLVLNHAERQTQFLIASEGKQLETVLHDAKKFPVDRPLCV